MIGSLTFLLKIHLYNLPSGLRIAIKGLSVVGEEFIFFGELSVETLSDCFDPSEKIDLELLSSISIQQIKCVRYLPNEIIINSKKKVNCSLLLSKQNQLFLS